MSTPLVEVDNVSKRFQHEGQDLIVCRDVSLKVDRGEMLCVVGPSGAGKSTLLHLIGTLDLPTKGRIIYEGTDVTGLSSSELAAFRNASIGFVFQFHHLLPEFTALENVMMPGMIGGANKAELKRSAEQLLDDVGLSSRLSHRPGEMSGGEQQRVALARALVMNPKLVLADEPTGNLDSETSELIHRLFFRMNEERGTSFLIVTHSRDLAGLMPRVVTMRDGVVDSDNKRALERPLQVPAGATDSEPERDSNAPEDTADAAQESPADADEHGSGDVDSCESESGLDAT